MVKWDIFSGTASKMSFFAKRDNEVKKTEKDADKVKKLKELYELRNWIKIPALICMHYR